MVSDNKLCFLNNMGTQNSFPCKVVYFLQVQTFYGFVILQKTSHFFCAVIFVTANGREGFLECQ